MEDNKMRTTLDLPNDLLSEAMKITHAKTKTEVIKIALENIIKQERINTLVRFHGKVDLEIDMNVMRNR